MSDDKTERSARTLSWRQRLPFLIVLLSLLALFLVPQWGGHKSRMERWLQDFTHFPLFAAITTFLIVLWRHHGPVLEKALGVAFAALFLIVAVEVIQPYVGRSASLADILIGAAGALSVVTVYLSIKARTLSGRRWLAACTGVSAAAAIVPFLVIVADWYRARIEFPMIDSFEQPVDLGRWEVNGFDVERVMENATDGDYALRMVVTRVGHDVPSLFLNDGPGDWRGFSRLSIDVYLAAEGESRTLWIRADDKVYPKYPDRSQMAFSIRPGWNTIWLDLGVFSKTPSGRTLNLGDVRTIGLFLENPVVGDTLYVDRLYLSGRDRRPAVDRSGGV